ncbi:outer membrane beta-barrel protein [Buchnera aphidicola]|uniref:outer membrane beta-barrel protein n=1 Tax=Buchnera aphidicola TaxID=9 RepID=UPI00346445F2
MKKRATAIAFLLASLVTSMQANAENQWYMGTKLGWSYLNLLSKDENAKTVENNITKNKLSAPITGLFLGYNFNPYFGLEMSNDTTGSHPHLIFKKKTDLLQLGSLQLSTKFSYPMEKNFNLYTNVGGVLFWEDFSSKQDFKNIFSKDSKVIPSISLGAEYVTDDDFITRVDYTWKNHFKNIFQSPFESKTGDISVSFGWKFGNSKMNETASLYSNAISPKPYITINETIHFPFENSDIQSNGCEKLHKLDAKIKNMKLKNISIVLSGYTDRMEDARYSQILSEERAYNVRDYFVSQGFSRNTITLQGLGNSFSTTEKICKNLKNTDLLMNCLSPDRRVDIEVLATR